MMHRCSTSAGLIGLFLGFILGGASSLNAQQSPADLVNPFIGSSNSRWMHFPGPAMPFGMVKLSPDNQANVWNGGYEYTIASVAGFSHIHSWAMSGLSVMPTTGDVRTFPGPADGPFDRMWTAGYRSRIDKQTEQARLGYYGVVLYDYDIKAELTTTTRCGYLRFTYPEAQDANILFNFNFEAEENSPAMLGAYVERVSDTEIAGSIRQRSSFADEYTVHFVARFSKPMRAWQTWQAEPFSGANLYGTDWQARPDFSDADSRSLQGRSGAAARFSTQAGDVIEVQTAISLVSIEQARLNLTTEMQPFGWDFQAVAAHHVAAWEELLGRVQIKGGAAAHREQFYTSLYRAYAGRTIWNDVNGRYMDMCENEQALPPDTPYIFGSDALWGAHWNLFPLWTLLTPQVANDWVNSLLEMADRGGWLPQGPEGIEYCEVMVAAHQILLIVSAYQKGIRQFDVQKAYEAILKIQTTPGRPHECGGWVGHKNLDSYLKNGFVANEDGPVSNTLEIAFDDWAAAQLALALGKRQDYEMLMARSRNYRNIFDSGTGYMRQKHADGRWVEDWDPLYNHGTWYGAGYVEGTAWHYSFYVPHDLPGLAEMAGRERLVERLEEGFRKQYIDIGNQPNMQAPFLFNHLGAPWLTQRYAREVLTRQFDDSPLRGYPGEEDQGQLSAWFALAALGLFQMDGGAGAESYYDLTTPLFEEITLQLDESYYGGNRLTIRSLNHSPENVYIQEARWNGKPLREARIAHHDLVQGGELVFELGPQPNKQWGTWQ